MTVQPGEETRAALVDAAERLMAERGVYAVELKEIMEAAGARNRSAVQYHFGGREGLVRAIGAKHRPPINEARNRMLDRLGPDPSIDEIVEAAVVPIARCLGSPSGRAYLIVAAESASRVGAARLHAIEREHDSSVHRVVTLLDQRLPGSIQARHLAIGQTMLTIMVLLADIARDVDAGAITASQGTRRARSVIAYTTDAINHRGRSERR
jgi:AcrR family transcriptional regulator